MWCPVQAFKHWNYMMREHWLTKQTSKYNSCKGNFLDVVGFGCGSLKTAVSNHNVNHNINPL